MIAKAADKLPDIRAIVKLQSFKFTKPDGKFIELANTNRVLRTNAYCDGMKTGFTEAYCLGYPRGQQWKAPRHVVCLSHQSARVWKDAEALLEWALKA